MSADDGWLIRKNTEAQYVLQHYFASDDQYPPIDSPRAEFFDTLEAAVMQCSEYELDCPSEYGLRVLVYAEAHPLAE